MKIMPVDFATLIFILSSPQRQFQLISFFDESQKESYLTRLLISPFFASALPEYLYKWIDSQESKEVFDYKEVDKLNSLTGLEFEVTDSANKLLNACSSELRAKLLNSTKDQYGGKMPKHLDGIFYKDLLLDIDTSSLTNLISYVDTRKLAVYLEVSFNSDVKSQLLASIPSVLSEKLNKVDLSLMSKKDEIVIEMESALSKAMSKLES